MFGYIFLVLHSWCKFTFDSCTDSSRKLSVLKKWTLANNSNTPLYKNYATTSFQVMLCIHGLTYWKYWAVDGLSKKHNTDLKEDLSTFAIHRLWNALLRLQTQITTQKKAYCQHVNVKGNTWLSFNLPKAKIYYNSDALDVAGSARESYAKKSGSRTINMTLSSWLSKLIMPIRYVKPEKFSQCDPKHFDFKSLLLSSIQSKRRGYSVGHWLKSTQPV